ncbi:MAG: CoB--CoM heterodisulfide reductase iron-sulfur subunit B family protein [Dehalococcoidia bacterium]|nr:CoB--CoM heterodisulfide reductase iron-sulfur subunit B family protein [Dehalococcoidia bacterium]
MELAYYPGCTLKTRAQGFETSAIAVMKALGIDLVELPRWNCCGTVYSLAEDDLIHHVAAVRNLIRVKEQGKNKVVTLCAFCYNTLKRANLIMKDSPDKRFAVNSFMDEELPYAGEVETVHLLQVLRDDVGTETITARVKRPLTGTRVAAYYGCTLLRPATTAIDNSERPTVLQNVVKALGGTATGFPFATECCGAYLAVNNPDVISERANAIISSAVKNGAEVVIVSCPLCEFNLRQAKNEYKLPVLYFTQLMALAFGLDPAVCGFEENSPETRAWLKSKGLVS